MKKAVGIILAFMVLAFSAIPCADENSLSGDTHYELAQSMPRDNEQDHTDDCSPFCICSCCAAFSVISKLPVTPTLFIPYQNAHAVYISERLYSIALPVWQPPQLV
ncbi:MAG TPA: DUF6660 family protein [Chitinophagaceae bacterium]